MIFLFPAFLDNYAGQVRSSILGYNNIWQILSGDSYFEGQGYLKPLTHIWALSLEMQFYLLIALSLERVYKNKHKISWAVIFVCLSLFSYALLLLNYDGIGDPTRVYYGLDTRLFSFSLGALAALSAEPGKARSEVRKVAKNILLFLLTLILIAGYVLPIDSSSMIRYGMFAYSIIFAITLAVGADDESFLTDIGETSLVQWIVSRSYFIYLWHFPVFVIAERLLFAFNLPNYVLYSVQIISSIVLSEVSYLLDLFYRRKRRTIWAHKLATKLAKNQAESDGALASWPGSVDEAKQRPEELNQLEAKHDRKIRNMRLHQSLSRLILPLILGAALLFLPWQNIYELRGGANFRQLERDIADAEARIIATRDAYRQRPSIEPSPSTESDDQDTTTVTEQENTTTSKEHNVTNKDVGTGSLETSTTQASTQPSDEAIGPDERPLLGSISLPVAKDVAVDDWAFQESLTYIEAFNASEPDLYLDLETYYRYRDINLTMIGDSVSVINSYHIYPYFPNLQLDALSNRQMHEIWDIYQDLKSDGLIGEVLVVGLGSNGEIDQEALAKVWQDLGDKPMFLVNIVLPYSVTEAQRNGDLENFVKNHDGVYLVDWKQASLGHAEYFQEDLIHPSGYGSKAYCQLLAREINSVLSSYEQAGLLEFYLPD